MVEYLLMYTNNIYLYIICISLLGLAITFITIIFAHPLIAVLFNQPRNRFLIMFKSFNGKLYTVNLNTFGFLAYRFRTENKVEVLNKLKESLIDLINSLDSNKINNKAKIYFETWLLGKCDINDMLQYGFEIRKINKKATFALKAIYFICNRRLPTKKWKWYEVSFDKKLIVTVQNLSRTCNGLKEYRRALGGL